MNTLDALYGAILQEPGDLDRWAAYADALEESEYAAAIQNSISWIRQMVNGRHTSTLRGWMNAETTVARERSWRNLMLEAWQQATGRVGASR